MTPTTGSPRAQTERRVTRRVETGRASQTEIAHPLVVVRNADYAPWTAPTPPTAPDVAADEEPVNLINRAFNVAIASLAMVVLSPVLLLVALAVKLTSPGPIVYTQTRVGLNRRGYGRTLAYAECETSVGARSSSTSFDRCGATPRPGQAPSGRRAATPASRLWVA
jgi:hypothetical protein